MPEQVSRPANVLPRLPVVRAEMDAPFYARPCDRTGDPNNFAGARARIEAGRRTGGTNLGLLANPRFGIPTIRSLRRTVTQLNAGFQQDIPTHGKLRLDRSVATQALRQAEISFFQDRFDLLTQVRSQFYTVMAAERRVEVLRGLIAIATRARNAASNLEQAGSNT